MRPATSAHVDELIRAADGCAQGRDPLIGQSWLRCMGEYRLDPTAPRRAYIHDQQRLREHQEAMDDLVRVARFGIETLYRQVSGLGYVLILSDAKGVAVDYIGDPAHDDELRRAGLYRGSDWSEPLAGTCAVGTCIATGEALVVHLDDHFAGDHIALTCTAAPIFASDGTLAAVLDISALQSPTAKPSQHLALQLVQSFAHRIETASLHNRFRRDWIVHLSRSREFADIEPDLALAIDAGGRITGFNSHARRALAVGAGSLLGMRFDQLFEASVDDLPSLTRSMPFARRTLTLRGGGQFFALALRPAEVARPPAPPLPKPLAEISGGDAAMDALARRAGKLVDAGLSILLQGETGTGKEHVARALHAASARAKKAFVPVDCAALSDATLEAELFGGEGRGRKGLVQQADGGTLFLDEIGDMPLLAQTRLLRVLAEREVAAVGGDTRRPVDLQVIAATHRDLRALVRDGAFRQDLYFRLNSAVFDLPPLRQRADLDWLIDRLLALRPGKHLAAPARAALHRHDWPGNVRELAHALDYAAALAATDEIGLDDLPALVASAPPRPDPPTDEIEPVLRRNGWNVSAAAREVGLDRTTVHRRIRKLGLVAPNKAPNG